MGDQEDDLADRLDRTAEWNGHLRASERADLRDAARRLRAMPAEADDTVVIQMPLTASFS